MTSNAQSSRYAAHSVLSSGKWVKIRVGSEGVYQITKTSLKNMGFADPSKVKLYGYNRPVLPETNIQDIEDDLVEIPLYRETSTSRLLFYSVGTTQWTRKAQDTKQFKHFNNPYSSYIYYFLTEATDDTPAEFTKYDAQSEATITQSTTYAHSIVESDGFSFINCGRTFFENYDYANGASKSYSLSLPDLTNSDVQVEVQFAAAGSSSSQLLISHNGQVQKTEYFSLLANDSYLYANVQSDTFTIYGYSSEKMTLTLQHKRNSGVTGHLDYIQANYERSITLSGNQYITFSPMNSGTTVFEISGCDANTSVWNVTSPDMTYELKGTLSANGTYKVLADDVYYTDTYVAVNTSKTFPSPEIVGKVANQDLHSLSDIQLVIIVPANGKLTEQAQRLADAHAKKEGMKCYVVTADKVYNEFSSGTPDATAYRRFMKMLYDKANDGESTIAPENILLFGACMWDNRFVTSGLTKLSQDNYLLCWESDNSWSHTSSYVLEEYFALLDDTDGSDVQFDTADIGVGRIPVTTVSEATGVVDKLITYINNEYAGAWQNTVCLMADDGNTESDATKHMDSAEKLAKTIKGNDVQPNMRIKKIYWDAYKQEKTTTGLSYPDVTDEINKTMSEGALIMNYTGHGAAYCLSHEQVVKTANFQNWKSQKLPLWLTAACDVTPFDMNTENIGVEALLNPDGGAMGFVGTARTVYEQYNYMFNNSFMRHVLSRTNGKANTIGQALSLAKNEVKGSKYQTTQKTNKCHFILLGDPAITLPLAKYHIVIDRINGTTSDNASISAGDVVTVDGHIEDENNNTITDYDGVVSSTVFDNEEKVTCKNNLGFQDEYYTYYDYTHKLFESSDSIRGGQFTFSFPVPMDNNYSNSNGLISLYAVNNDNSIIANGKATSFIIGGTSNELDNDTIGPDICVKYVDYDNVIDSLRICDTPTVLITLADDNGINATGNGLGHDIVAILDGKESTTYVLNDYYVQTIGDYTSGSITYTFPAIDAGVHYLTVRAFDTYNNMSEKNYMFEVFKDLKKSYEYYDFTGRLVASEESPTLPNGTYILVTRFTSDGEEVTHTSKKVLIAQ